MKREQNCCSHCAAVLLLGQISSSHTAQSCPEHSQPLPGSSELPPPGGWPKVLAEQAGDRGAPVSVFSEPWRATDPLIPSAAADPLTTCAGIFTQLLAQLLPAVWQSALTLLINP